MNKKQLGTLILILAAAGLWVIFTPKLFKHADSQDISAPHEGFDAPGFELSSMSGEVVALEDFKGHPVVLNLWASWCPPCRMEMPAMEKIYQAYQSQGVEFIAVNMTYQDDLNDAKSFVEENDLTFNILLDEKGDVANLYQMQGLPTTYFINSSGEIHKVVIGGPIPEEVFEKEILAMLEEEE